MEKLGSSANAGPNPNSQEWFTGSDGESLSNRGRERAVSRVRQDLTVVALAHYTSYDSDFGSNNENDDSLLIERFLQDLDIKREDEPDVKYVNIKSAEDEDAHYNPSDDTLYIYRNRIDRSDYEDFEGWRNAFDAEHKRMTSGSGQYVRIMAISRELYRAKQFREAAKDGSVDAYSRQAEDEASFFATCATVKVMITHAKKYVDYLPWRPHVARPLGKLAPAIFNMEENLKKEGVSLEDLFSDEDNKMWNRRDSL